MINSIGLLISYDLPSENNLMLTEDERTMANTLRNGFRRTLMSKFKAEIQSGSLMLIKSFDAQTMPLLDEEFKKWTLKYSTLPTAKDVNIQTWLVVK